jgi:hypothetical protein
MKNTLFAIALISLSLLVDPAQQSRAENPNRTALVIGNSAYGQAGQLRNPVNDATDIAALLQQLGFEVTLLRDVDLRQMEGAIDSFNRQLHRGGVGLFYYAGHGVQVDGENYLIPLKAQIERSQDVRYEAVPLGRILGAMEEAGNDINIIILDACRDNPFARRWRSIQRGLAAVQAVRGAFIAFATEPGGVALDGEGRNGVYTSHLLQYLKTPNLDVELMFKQVRAGVVQETQGRQTPWESSSLIGSFSFNPSTKNTATASVTPQPTIAPDMEVNLNPPSRPAIIAFTATPRLLDYATTQTVRKASGATYYFTVDLPENAGFPLQKLTIQQSEAGELIDRYHFDETLAFEGTRSQRGSEISLTATLDQDTRTITVVFDPPISPGKTVTVGLRPVSNPSSGVYTFRVTAFPAGEGARGLSLGVARLHFYDPF